MVHGRPFSAKPAGAVFAPDQAPLKPNVTEPPGAIDALYGTFAAATDAPDWLTAAFHACVTLWPDGHVQASCQPLTGAVPVLRTVTCAVNPADHWFCTA